MEVESRPAPSLPTPRHTHYQHHEQHHQLQPVDGHRQTLPSPAVRSPPSASLTPAPQKSPANNGLPPPSTKPLQYIQYTQPSPKEDATARNRTNGQSYPRPPQEVQLDAIERLQTQLSQNSSALMAQSRELRRHEEFCLHQEALRRDFSAQSHHQSNEIRRVDDVVLRCQQEMQDVRHLLEVLTREVQAQSLPPRVVAPAATTGVQDSAVELIAQQIAVISQRTNEIDTLKITIEIMKNKIQRLEEAAAETASQPLRPHAASPLQHPNPLTQSPHALSSYRSLPPASHMATPVHPPRLQAQPSQGSQSERGEPVPPPAAWASINAGSKRGLHGIESPQESVGTLDSPKRAKLAPIEPRGAYATLPAPSQPPHKYEYMETDDSDAARAQAQAQAQTQAQAQAQTQAQARGHTLSSQAHSLPPAESAHPSQHSPAAFIQYASQDGASHDAWHAAKTIRTPRGRGRGGGGGGPGSRGGRLRKSTEAPGHALSPTEWERQEWPAAPSAQASPDGLYLVTRGMGKQFARRGSGGGGAPQGVRPPSRGRASSVGLQTVPAESSFGIAVDPYAHTKKTRTKPIRNADGILIRKDGRPDMRSQSSAANLRKAHTRKDDQTSPEPGFTIVNHPHSASNDVESPSSSAHAVNSQDLPASTQKKHRQVMDKMFPAGPNESRRELDHSRRVFEEDQDHKVHPRTAHHNYHHQDHRQQRTQRDGDIKHEPYDEQHNVVDVDHPEDHADDEGQTPGDSEASGQDSNREALSRSQSQHRSADRDAHPSSREHGRQASKGHARRTSGALPVNGHKSP